MEKIKGSLIITAVFLLTISLYAYGMNSIDIDNLTVNSKSISINFTVLGLKETDQVTVLVYKKEDDDTIPDSSNTVYIDQVTNSDNMISFELLRSAASGKYGVLMGGTNINSPAISEFELFDILYGDVNRDGLITADDAVWILKFSSGATMPDGISIINGDVNNDKLINITDAVWILKYSENETLPDCILINR